MVDTMSIVWKIILILYGLYCALVIIESIIGLIPPEVAGRAVGSMLVWVIIGGFILDYIYKKISK